MSLTENEKRDVVKLIEADKPLPDKYRFLLFDDKREVELVWNGKSKIVVDNGQIVRIGKDKTGKITREPLTKHWTDWIDYWAVDFDFESKREIIRVRNEDTGMTEEQWSGDYIFENEWQSFRTRKDRSLELTSVAHECPPGRRKIAVKVVDIFGNDTMKIVEVGGVKIKLKNLGALKEAEFELAELSIICGENNTGKTYATYALYGFLGQWRSLLDRVYHSTVSFIQINKSARDAAEILLKDGVVILDIMDHIKYARIALNAMCEIYTLELPSVFSSHPKIFDGASFSIKIDNNEYLENNLLRLDFKKNGPYLDFEKNEGDKNIKISRSTPIEELDSLDPAAQKAAVNILLSMSMQEIDLLDRKGLHDSIARTSLQIIFSLLFPNVFISSTERTGAAIFEKELNFARNSLLEKMSSAGEKEDLRKLLSKSYQSYALPVMENVEFVRKLSGISKGSSFIAEKHSEVLSDLSDIIGGDYSVHKQIGLQYKPKGEDFKLSMGESSSSVRSLLDIGFYLRHQARVGDLLMIDEPELNLHPRNQRRIARLFARLVNLGLKVFVTTHSDYIVKEFNTLIMLNRDMSHLKRIAKEENYHSDELLDINKVKLYISKRASIKRENKQKRSMCQTLVAANISQEGGIEVDSFDQTINKMNEIQDSIMWGYDKGDGNE